YAYGGFDGTNFLDTVEVYVPFGNTWSTVAPMTTARSGLAGAATSIGNVYAFGGFDGSNYLNTAEVYRAFTNTWSPIANMSIARYGAAAAAGLDGRIYVIGGLGVDNNSGFSGALNTVEAYSPFSNTWTTVASMAT